MGQERKWDRSQKTPGLGQEHGRSGQDSGNNRAGAFYLYFLALSAPMEYFKGRSRVGAEQERERSKAGARAGQEQEPNHNPNTKFHPNWA